MAMQEQPMSDFARRLGARVAEANQEHAAKSIDTGNRRLPPGIRNGVAKLSTAYTKASEADEHDAKTPKGETFFRASATVMGRLTAAGLTTEFDGEDISGMITSQVIPLCDSPAKGKRKAKTFSENWDDFQNLFKLLGVFPPDGREGRPDYTIPQNATDAVKIGLGQAIQAYYFAAMKSLVDPQRPQGPVYIEFSTRGWKPPKLPGSNEEPQELTFETWHGLADMSKVPAPDPAAGMSAGPPPTNPPAAPPSSRTQAPAPTRSAPPVAPSPAPPTQVATAALEPPDPALVAELVALAMADPEGATQDGAAAAGQLEDMALANGWTEDQTGKAANWAAVGEMALTKPSAESPAAATSSANGQPTAGSRWRFAKRDQTGNKLKNAATGAEFPAQDVEVVSVDPVAKTCTVKTTHDGKEIVNIRTKAAVPVKFEWLETIPY